MSRPKATFFMTLLVFVLGPVHYSVAQVGVVAGFAADYVLGKGVDYVWDAATGQGDGLELKKRLLRLESATSTIPEISNEIRTLHKAIGSKISRKEFERRVKPMLDRIGEIENRVCSLEMRVERLEVANQDKDLANDVSYFRKRANEFLEQKKFLRARACANVALSIDGGDIDSHFFRLASYNENHGMLLACCNDALKKIPDGAVFKMKPFSELGKTSKSFFRLLRSQAANEFGEPELAIQDCKVLLANVNAFPNPIRTRSEIKGQRGLAFAKLAIRKGGDTKYFNQALFDLYSESRSTDETLRKFRVITTISLLEQMRYIRGFGTKIMKEVESDLDSYFAKESGKEDVSIQHYFDRFRYLKWQDSGEPGGDSFPLNGYPTSGHILAFGETIREMEKSDSIAKFTDDERLRAYENIIRLYKKLNKKNVREDSLDEIEKVVENASEKYTQLRARNVTGIPSGVPFRPGGVWALTQVDSFDGVTDFMVQSESMDYSQDDPSRLVLVISYAKKSDSDPNQLIAKVEWAGSKDSFKSPSSKEQPDYLTRSFPYKDLNFRLTLEGKYRKDVIGPWSKRIEKFQKYQIR